MTVAYSGKEVKLTSSILPLWRNVTNKEVLDYLSRAEVAAVGTSDMGTPRQRMMHFGADDDFNIYVSSMKGDPKVIQWSNIPKSISIYLSSVEAFWCINYRWFKSFLVLFKLII